MANKQNILDEQLSKYLDQPVIVKFSGGREVRGTLRGFDMMANLVLEAAVETLRDSDDPYRLTDDTRDLGVTVCRGSQVSLIYPADGTEEIANPFMQPEA